MMTFKKKTMIAVKQKTIILFAFILLIVPSCKKDHGKSVTVATLTTSAVTNIASNTATSGGAITSNGNGDITASGVCWSKTNATPTIADDTTKGTTASGSFISNLKNLTSSSTYYVRAYATNSAGTGYGNIVTFMTGNAAPVASAVAITGQAEVNKTLTGVYTYSDAEGDAQSGSTFQWYVANDATGSGETAISGATTITYIVQAAEQGKYIRFGVTPKAGTGTTAGVEIRSSFIGAVGEATTVTFTYNGTSVTYGILTSPTTGRKWLDRNLGAPNVATSFSDWANFGDLFQWGRLIDGHQSINRTGPSDANMSGVNGTTTGTAPYQQSSTDNPGHNKFILIAEFPADWRKPQNSNLWQGVSGVNNPCPSGWRIPTQTEWNAESITDITNAYNKLKLTYTGIRSPIDGSFSLSTAGGYYWSSTVDGVDPTLSVRIRFNAAYNTLGANRANGNACRCIKN